MTFKGNPVSVPSAVIMTMNIIKNKPISGQVVLSAYEEYHSLSQLETAPRYYSDLVTFELKL